MVSVENLYWILYENLLKPVGLDCWYYYPFGTQDNLSAMGEFQGWKPKQEHHVLFHFDQEPLWENDLGMLYNWRPESWTNKIIKILANSEHSCMKKQMCLDRGLTDWYFFYHGFAALDWYRDSQYNTIDHAIQNAFLSFNHLVRHGRSYRIALISKLLELEIEKKGAISLHANFNDIIQELNDPNTSLSNASRCCIDRNLSKFIGLPWMLDDVPINGDMSARFGHQELHLWQQSLLHVVNETVFYQPKLHLTEKIFKPVVANRPFVIVGAPGHLAYLKNYGFKTFDRWIDESYDSILDHDLRLDAIAQQIAKISKLSRSQLRELYQDMKPLLDFNKKHFFNEFRNHIVNELVENFDTCIRIWNNGRIDGRELPRINDLASVKHLLLK